MNQSFRIVILSFRPPPSMISTVVMSISGKLLTIGTPYETGGFDAIGNLRSIRDIDTTGKVEGTVELRSNEKARVLT